MPPDEELMQRFHESDWSERPGIAGQIADDRLKEFAHRLIYVERQDLLPEPTLGRLKSWHAERLLTKDDTVPWMTISKATLETEELLAEGTADKTLLGDFKAYLIELEAKLSAPPIAA